MHRSSVRRRLRAGQRAVGNVVRAEPQIGAHVTTSGARTGQEAASMASAWLAAACAKTICVEKPPQNSPNGNQ
jgi:hypothetical protein